LKGIECATKVQIQVSANAKNAILIYGDSISSSIIIQTESIKEIFFECVKRGIKYKYITEITKENIPYCKEVLKIIRPGELRHLDGVKGILQ
jgi:hypothetical protein